MSSHYSCSPEDDFYQSLNKSLSLEYSSQMLSNFISDLIVAISNVDEDPEAGFIFNDDENDDSKRYGCFTLPLSLIDSFDEPRRKNEASEKKASNISVDMFDDEPSQETLPRNETTSRKPKDNVSVDMFADFQSDNEAMDVDSDCSVEVNFNEHPNVVDCQNDLDAEAEVTDHFKNFNRNEQQDVDELEVDQIGEMPNVVFSQNIDAPGVISIDEAPLNECPRVVVSTKQKLVQQQIESEGTTGENIEIDKLSQSLDVLVCAPSNISCNTNESIYCEPNQGTILRRNVQPARSESTKFHNSSRSESFKEGSMGERPSISIDAIANTSMQSSSSSSDFLGFSPVGSFKNFATLQKPIDCSSRVEDERIANICDDYETANSLVAEIRSVSSRSTNFGGFAPVGSFRNRAVLQNPIACLSRIGSELSTNLCKEYETANSVVASSRSTNFRRSSPGSPLLQIPTVQNSRSEDDLNTTFCEEYETAERFIAELNAMRISNFSFEEAYSQCFLESQNQNADSSSADRRQTFINAIEQSILRFKNDLVCGRKLTIKIPYTVSWDNCVIDDERVSLNPLSDGRTRVIEYKHRIALILYVLSFVYKLLITNKTCTKREIYYSDPQFTQSQMQVDNAIMDVCLILNARPWEIGILSSSKGLIAGPIKLTLNDDTIVDVGRIDGGILLPHHTVDIKKVETAAKFVLLVEKHTVYQKLLLENILIRLEPCVLVTGKGYPDKNTRIILKKIWDDCKCPIYALVDADPHGIEIMLTYRHGSKNLSFLNDDLAIPSIRWIGVYPSEIKKLKLKSLPLTKEDVCRVDSMINRNYLSKKICKELLVLKKKLQKTEVEALTSTGTVDWIGSYLLNKIRSGSFI